MVILHEKFQADIKADTLCTASVWFNHWQEEQVKLPGSRGRECALPWEVEEGLVEIVELLH
jgi:hypothetical protein